MKYVLISSDQKTAQASINTDGSIKMSGVRILVGIEGAPEGKFVQVDMVSFDMPLTIIASEIPTYLDEQIALYVPANYPDTNI